MDYSQYPIDNSYHIDNKCIKYNKEPEIISPKINNKKTCHFCDCKKRSQLIENDDGFWCKFHYERLYGLTNLEVKIKNKL
jgi:hypothetical protein